MRNLLLGVTLTAASLVAVFALFEVYVRSTTTDGRNFDIEMWRYARDLKRVSDIPGVGHEHVPGRAGTYMGVEVKINSAGWRDRDYEMEKPAGAVRIMMLGDSLTFGWGAPPKDVTANILEQMLNQDGGQIYEVLNTGVGNTNTAMQVAYFIHEGYKYAPDMVVLNYFINDAEPTPTRTRNWLIENSYAAVVLAGRLDILMRTYFDRGDWKSYYGGLYASERAGWRNTRAAIAALADFCHRKGIDLVVVNYPELHQLSPYPFKGISDLVRAEAAINGLPFLDLQPAVAAEPPRSLWVTETDAHPNGRAARRFARAIAGFLREHFPTRFDTVRS